MKKEEIDNYFMIGEKMQIKELTDEQLVKIAEIRPGWMADNSISNLVVPQGILELLK